MTRRRLVAASLFALAVAGCAGAPQRPAGPAPLAISSGEVKPWLVHLRKDLKHMQVRLPGLDEIDPRIGEEQQLQIDLPAAALFESGDAQLRIAALKPLADIAASIASYGACVVHIVGFGGDAGAAELAERRAATLAGDLGRHGIARARLRSESRVDAARGEIIVLALRPAVLEREPQAWIPPTLEP